MSPKNASTHELFVNENGTTTLLDKTCGETMHSKIGPKAEALELYITQSKLSQRLNASPTTKPLVLFDVGLGAGTNALAALQLAKALPQARTLHVVSFETQISGFALALQNRAQFPFFEGLESAAAELLEKKSWHSPDGKLQWTLHEASFLEAVKNCAQPEVVFFDFYSPKVNPELWGIHTFQKILALKKSGEPIDLYTYCASTRVRVAMLLAGFYVGYGQATQAKRDTTCASTQKSALTKLLDAKWLTQVSNSHLPFPADWETLQEKDALMQAFQKHPQFLGG